MVTMVFVAESTPLDAVVVSEEVELIPEKTTPVLPS